MDIPKAQYARFIKDNEYARELIDTWIERDKEGKLFPHKIFEEGYTLKGRGRKSKKTGYQKRRIKAGGIIYRIHPAFLASYMRGETEEIKWGLFLMKFGVPF